jgi:hypothetical protein
MCYVEESRSPLWSSGQSSWLRNGDVLCFLWGANWIYICYVEKSRPHLWSSDQSSCLHIQKSRFDSRRYQISWEVGGLKRGSLSLVSTIEELLGRKSRGSGLGSQEYGRRGPSRWPRGILYPQKLALTSRTSGDRSVGIVRLRTRATDFFRWLHKFLLVLLFDPPPRPCSPRDGQLTPCFCHLWSAVRYAHLSI